MLLFEFFESMHNQTFLKLLKKLQAEVIDFFVSEILKFYRRIFQFCHNWVGVKNLFFSSSDWSIQKKKTQNRDDTEDWVIEKFKPFHDFSLLMFN